MSMTVSQMFGDADACAMALVLMSEAIHRPLSTATDDGYRAACTCDAYNGPVVTSRILARIIADDRHCAPLNGE